MVYLDSTDVLFNDSYSCQVTVVVTQHVIYCDWNIKAVSLHVLVVHVHVHDKL